VFEFRIPSYLSTHVINQGDNFDTFLTLVIGWAAKEGLLLLADQFLENFT
jgi:hypothetical protein